jgi:hypothetical protein
MQIDSVINVPSAVSDGFEVLKWVVNTLIIPYGVYLVKRMDKQDDKLNRLDKKVETMNTTLVGQDGENGLRSRFKEVERLLTELRIGFSRHLGIEIRSVSRKDKEE